MFSSTQQRTAIRNKQMSPIPDPAGGCLFKKFRPGYKYKAGGPVAAADHPPQLLGHYGPRTLHTVGQGPLFLYRAEVFKASALWADAFYTLKCSIS